MLALSYVARVTNICRIRRILITSLLLILFSFAFDVKSLNQNKHAPKKTKKTFIHLDYMYNNSCAEYTEYGVRHTA